MTVVGKATLSENAENLAAWAIATMFLASSLKFKCWYFCGRDLELANWSVKFLLFATKGFFICGLVMKEWTD